LTMLKPLCMVIFINHSPLKSLMEEKRGDPSEAAFLKAQLRHETLSKIQALQQQGFYDDNDFYYLVKNFFKQYLGLTYECTIHELRTELKKIYLSEPVRQELDHILDHISFVEYVSDHHKPSETRDHLQAFQRIVEDLLEEESLSPITHFWQKLCLEDFFQHLKQRISPSKAEAQHQLEQLIPQLKKEIQEKNFETARKMYQQVMEVYNQLQEPEKAKYYQQISELYNILSTPIL